MLRKGQNLFHVLSLAWPITSWKDHKCALGSVSHRKMRFWSYPNLGSLFLWSSGEGVLCTSSNNQHISSVLVVALCIWDLMTLIYVKVLTRESHRSSYLLCGFSSFYEHTPMSFCYSSASFSCSTYNVFSFTIMGRIIKEPSRFDILVIAEFGLSPVIVFLGR